MWIGMQRATIKGRGGNLWLRDAQGDEGREVNGGNGGWGGDPKTQKKGMKMVT
jgi:hypothetical protein